MHVDMLFTSDQTDPLAEELCGCFCSSPAEDTGVSGTADEWNAQRIAVIDRLLRGILYPKLGRELLEALKKEAQARVISTDLLCDLPCDLRAISRAISTDLPSDLPCDLPSDLPCDLPRHVLRAHLIIVLAQDVLRAECATRLRRLALAPPCRAPKVDDERRAEEAGKKKKKKKRKGEAEEDAWVPPRATEDFYPRQARAALLSSRDDKTTISSGELVSPCPMLGVV